MKQPALESVTTVFIDPYGGRDLKSNNTKMSYCLEHNQICYQGYLEREVCFPCASPCCLSVAYTLEESLLRKSLMYCSGGGLRAVRVKIPQEWLLALSLGPSWWLQNFSGNEESVNTNKIKINIKKLDCKSMFFFSLLKCL